MPIPAVDCVASPCPDHVSGLVDDAGCPSTVIGRFDGSHRTQRFLRIISAGMVARLRFRCAVTRHFGEQNRACAFLATVGRPQISHVRMCLV